MMYASGADLIARYDVDQVGDLATDERETLDRANVADHLHVITALEDASSEVDAALLAGGRYTATQLQELTGSSASYLKSIVCGLAMAALHERRPEAIERDLIDRITKKARDSILSLRRGENVFGIVEVVDATRLQLSGPTALEIEDRNGMAERMHRYFPTTQSRLPRHQ